MSVNDTCTVLKIIKHINKRQYQALQRTQRKRNPHSLLAGM